MFDLEKRLLGGNQVEPLIGAEQTYPALERSISQASHTLHMAYWRIEPDLRPMSDTAEDAWADLLANAVRRGVTVRLLLADFDPVLGFRFHRRAWASYRHFIAIRNALPAADAQRLQVICSRHEARIGTAVRLVGQPIIQRFLSEAIEALEAVRATEGDAAMRKAVGDVPGLWPHITLNEAGLQAAQPTLPTVFPAAHHEKLCVVDDEVVFLGGLDINERRRDTHEHDADLAWHDVACQLTGPAASHFARHFRERWNYELDDFHAFIAQACPPTGVEPLNAPPTERIETDPSKTISQRSGEAYVAPLRTLSRQAKSTLSRSPITEIEEIRDAYLAIIERARRLIYIETQFLRSQTIVEALVERAEHESALEIVLLLPLVPEDVLVEGEPDQATQHGQHLGREALNRLREVMGTRFGVFTLTRAGGAAPDAVNEPKQTMRDIVYVHSKTMLVDDELAIIGSANLNDRSFQTDTETAIAWRESGAIQAYRHNLWRHALGIDVAQWGDRFVERWQQHAERNATLAADERQGFVMPLPESAELAHASHSFLVPTELI